MLSILHSKSFIKFQQAGIVVCYTLLWCGNAYKLDLVNFRGMIDSIFIELTDYEDI